MYSFIYLKSEKQNHPSIIIDSSTHNINNQLFSFTYLQSNEQNYPSMRIDCSACNIMDQYINTNI